MSEILKAGPPSYGHWRRFVQPAASARGRRRRDRWRRVLALAFAAPASARTLKLVALGDSLTAGLGLTPGQAFPDQLEAALKAKGWDVTVVDAGVSGDTAADGLARYDWSVPADADALIVELGANDMLRGLNPEATKRTLAAILDRARAAHLPTLLAGMRAAPNLGADYDRAFDAIYPALAQSYGRDPLPVLPRRRRRRRQAQPARRTPPDGGGRGGDRRPHPALGGGAAEAGEPVARELPVGEGVPFPFGEGGPKDRMRVLLPPQPSADLPVVTPNVTPSEAKVEIESVNDIARPQYAPLVPQGLSSDTVPAAALTPVTMYMWSPTRLEPDGPFPPVPMITSSWEENAVCRVERRLPSDDDNSPE